MELRDRLCLLLGYHNSDALNQMNWFEDTDDLIRFMEVGAASMVSPVRATVADEPTTYPFAGASRFDTMIKTWRALNWEPKYRGYIAGWEYTPERMSPSHIVQAFELGVPVEYIVADTKLPIETMFEGWARGIPAEYLTTLHTPALSLNL